MTAEVIIKLVDGQASDSVLEGVGDKSAFVRHVKALFPNAPAGHPTRSLFVAEIVSATPGAFTKFMKSLSSMKSVEYAELPPNRDLLAEQTLP